MINNKKIIVVGIGEVLWDKLPNENVLGGAPANVAYHISRLGGQGYIISAVGKDQLGDDIISLLSSKGVNLMINRVDYPTGTVNVTLDDKGVPNFVITKDVAWDYIELKNEIELIAKDFDAVCFGTLAQRDEISRKAIVDFLKLVPENTLKVFDINLRQNFYNKQIIEDSLNASNILKINDDELLIVTQFFNLKGNDEEICKELLDIFNLKLVALTCGEKGSYLFSESESSFIETPKVKVKDTIGAGDSFTAALIHTILNKYPLKYCHKFAVELSAFVCENKGAMPEYSNIILNKYIEL